MKGRRDGGEIIRCTVKGFHGNRRFFSFLFFFLSSRRSHVVLTRMCDKVTFVVTQAGGAFHATRSLTRTTHRQQMEPRGATWSFSHKGRNEIRPAGMRSWFLQDLRASGGPRPPLAPKKILFFYVGHGQNPSHQLQKNNKYIFSLEILPSEEFKLWRYCDDPAH